MNASRRYIVLTLLGCLGLFAPMAEVQADPIPKKYRKTIRRGLQWLVKQQAKDGHWSAPGDRYRTAMTALAGMALLSEGSTIQSGRYSKYILKATRWMMAHSNRGNNRDGLLRDGNDNQTYYMYGHGFGMLFLASVYGDEKDPDRRKKLKDILIRGVKYTINSQTTRGGWCYRSRVESRDNDEGSITITQMQALRAARNAGIPVPIQVIKNAKKYLRHCTSPQGGMGYSYSNPSYVRASITAAAVCCGFSAGQYDDPYVKKWLKYCQRTIGYGESLATNRQGHQEYTHLYLGQCIYVLGDDGWAKLYGSAPKGQRYKWSEYRPILFDSLVKMQQKDGAWRAKIFWGNPGAVYTTAVYLTILQLDNNALPIYQR